MKILIVDDEERIRGIFRKLLQRKGFDVIEAANAGDAYELVLTTPVDLILLDINMMGVDGTDLFEVLHLFFKKAKVIVTSVYPLEDQKRLIKGADDYYDKSDSLQNLIRKVHQVMESDGNPMQSVLA
jgi:two-component system phosphate regulon response regulator OmpR